jgi:flagellar biosynthetic protein FliQ
MNSDSALDLMNQLMWNSLVVAAPVLIVALVVGLAVSVLQVGECKKPGLIMRLCAAA